MLCGDLLLASPLLAPSLLPLLLASLLLLRAALATAALPHLALLPLDGLGAGVAAELGLQLHHAVADHVALATGLVAVGPLGPVAQQAVCGCVVGEEEGRRIDRSIENHQSGDSLMVGNYKWVAKSMANVL